jgi:uncharacterized RDD family membrane protein YckC
MSKVIITSTNARVTANMLHQVLKADFGNNQVTMGLESFISNDNNPHDDIQQAVTEAKVLVVLVGDNWLADGWASDPDHPQRIGLMTAQSTKKSVLFIAVDEAKMPSANELPSELASIAERIPIPLRTTRFRQDAQAISETLERFLAKQSATPTSAGQYKLPTLVLASGWERFFAYAIDAFILNALLRVLETTAEAQIRNAFSLEEARSVLLVYLIFALILYTSYQILCGALGGQTLGKMIIGTRVVKPNGDLLGWRDALLRAFGYVLNGFTFGIGFGWLLVDEKRQGWHDKIAKTIVVNIRQRR